MAVAIYFGLHFLTWVGQFSLLYRSVGYLRSHLLHLFPLLLCLSYSFSFVPGPGPPVQMIQSPPQITSPSLSQSQFNFPPTSVSLPHPPVNHVRSVSPAVISHSPGQSVLLLRPQGPNEMTTQIIPQSKLIWRFVRLARSLCRLFTESYQNFTFSIFQGLLNASLTLREVKKASSYKLLTWICHVKPTRIVWLLFINLKDSFRLG